MNNWLLVFSIVLVFFLLIGLNFESLFNYGKWTVPLNELSDSPIYYGDQHISMYGDKPKLTPTVSSVDYIDENTLELTFNKNGFFMGDYEIPNEFEFVTKLKVGDKFISSCFYSDVAKLFHISIFHLVEITDTHSIFNHHNADLPPQAECKYPEIIEHSLNIDWNDFSTTRPE